MLSVYFEDYKADIGGLKASGLLNKTGSGASEDPDGLMLERLRKFVEHNKLTSQAGNIYIQLVQNRRNAIHAFKDRPIGDDAEFQTALRSHLALLREINDRLPYPDELHHKPREAQLLNS